jgi:hypothetical protein
MFTITENQATAIRAAFEHGGEFAAVVDFRRLFPAITDDASAGECALMIAGWPPAMPGPDPQRTLRTGRT